MIDLVSKLDPNSKATGVVIMRRISFVNESSLFPNMNLEILFIFALGYGLTFSACGEDELATTSMSEEQAGMSAGITAEELPMIMEACTGPVVEEGVGMAKVADNDLECSTCEGSDMPNFAIQDLSPTSCGYGRHYSLNAFEGKLTFVVLLRSTCGYCHAQLEKLEQMRFELIAMGFDLNMVVINEIGTEGTVDLLHQRSQIAILQDVPEVMAWQALSSSDSSSMTGQVGGDKDDMYIYSAEGKLWRFLDDDDPTHQLNLSGEEGYNYLKNTLIEALSE